jgi:hypothetical protein
MTTRENRRSQLQPIGRAKIMQPQQSHRLLAQQFGWLYLGPGLL